MKLVENPAAAKAVLEEAIERANAKERTPGLHVSDLISCRRRAWYKRRGILPPVTTSQEQESIFLLGQGHHRVLQPSDYAEIAFMIIDTDAQENIHGHIDAYWPQNPLWGQPTEIKSTRYSSSKDAATDTPHYIEQLAAYVLGMGVTRGRLLVWYMMGNYADQRAPVLKAYDIEFSQHELDAWREELLNRKEIILAPDPPDVLDSNHYKWECEYCPYSHKRGGLCETGKGDDTPFFFNTQPPNWSI